MVTIDSIIRELKTSVLRGGIGVKPDIDVMFGAGDDSWVKVATPAP